jgi:hydrogenase maturation factor
MADEPLRPGKLPAHLLARLLASVPHDDPRVLVGPRVGSDAAVIDIGGGRVLVAKTDPITFAADDLGWYAVHVNANDIACMGARPMWMLATALLPPASPASLASTIFQQLVAACRPLAIELVGGHTEVTFGIDRPMLVAAMLGEAAIEDVIRGDEIAPGDTVLIAGAIAIEGTALLARERPAALARAGVPDATIARAQRLLRHPGISIVRHAEALRAAIRPKLLHDATEGGLATALAEVATRAGAGIRIDPGAVPVLDETRTVCAALGLDPLGLLASGALLAVTEPPGERSLPEGWRTIGTVVTAEPGVIMVTDGDTPLPAFERDELARFFESEAAGT